MGFRYLGNKSRLAEWIVEEVRSELPVGSRVVDPMCGTATVGVALATAGYNVTASDELRFPVLHAKARLLGRGRRDFSPVAESYERAIELLNMARPTPGFFWREYSSEGSPSNGCKPRMYFTGENAAKIDAIRRTIKRWRAAGLHDDSADLLLHDLIMAVNSVANIAGTYGYFRSTWNKASLAPIQMVMSPKNVRGRNLVVQGRLEDVAPTLKGDACYLDPPYTKRQYGGNYHLLETIACGDFPEPVGEGGLRDWYPNSSDFCSKRRVEEAFRRVISGLQMKLIFISYSEDGLLPQEKLLDLLSDYGAVERKDFSLARFRSNGGKSGVVQEHLYVLRRTT